MKRVGRKLTITDVDDAVQRFGGHEGDPINGYDDATVRLFADDRGRGGIELTPAEARILGMELIESAALSEVGS